MSRILPFSRYALALGVMTIVLYVAFGVLSLHQYQHARDALQASDMSGALEELDSSLNKALQDLRSGVESIAAWDEISQQLNNPVYFVYWYSHRIKGSGALDDRFHDLMLYDAEGKALSVFEGMGLPDQIAPGAKREIYQSLGGQLEVQFFLPLRNEDSSETLGYLGLSARLLPALQRMHLFRLMDASSLSFPVNARFETVDDIRRSAQFRLLPTRHFALVDELVSEVLIIMGVLVILPSLVLLVSFTSFAGRAVRRVPEVVRVLRDSGQRHPDELEGTLQAARQGMQIKELHTAEQFVMQYHRDLSSANSVLDQKNRELWTLAHQDPLTGTRNRRAFDDYLKTLEELSARSDCASEFRLMLCDVNHFKAINDSYGHQVGDAVLSAVANCLDKAMRSNETLFRLGGDEFACVLQDCDDAHAVAVARRCEESVRRFAFSDLGLDEPVRLSVGISESTGNNDVEIKDLLRQADMAMYASKRPGSRSISLYDPHMADDSGGIFSTSANEAVYLTIDRGEGIKMHYQPVVETGAFSVCYYEALLRLERGGRVISPSEVFPLVESRHLELDMDRAVLRQVYADIRVGRIPADSGVSINLSAPSIVHDEVIDWLRPFVPFLDSYSLVIEITETSLVTQMEAAKDNLAKMRQLGFMVALDDFGSGYSSLRYLTSMPVDVVKFDISLIHTLTDPAKRRLVQHLVELIRDAGQKTVAEGIETSEMLDRVADVGFTNVQGYLLGRPEPLVLPYSDAEVTAKPA